MLHIINQRPGLRWQLRRPGALAPTPRYASLGRGGGGVVESALAVASLAAKALWLAIRKKPGAGRRSGYCVGRARLPVASLTGRLCAPVRDRLGSRFAHSQGYVPSSGRAPCACRAADAGAHAVAPACRISAFALQLVSGGFPGISGSIQAPGVLARSSRDFAQFRRGRIGHLWLVAGAGA
jgi:hypothetical protein